MKARKFSHETQVGVVPLELDISTTDTTEEVLNDVSLVVMCIDQADNRWVEQCLRRGIHYVDVSASYEFLSMVESLDTTAKQHGATAVLSVGLAPGLTNLLARHSQSVFDELRRIDIFVMLGLGEADGEEAIRWTVENINAEFSVSDNGGLKRVQSFGDGKETVFSDIIGRRIAYRFHFSDQHPIPKTLGIDSVSTSLCFDSAPITRFFALLKKTGLTNILGLRPTQDILVGLLKMFHLGSDKYVIQVDAKRTLNGQPALYECAISGHGEGRTTGLVAAPVAESLYTSSFPPGVFHIEQLFDPLEFTVHLQRSGLRLSLGEVREVQPAM